MWLQSLKQWPQCTVPALVRGKSWRGAAPPRASSRSEENAHSTRFEYSHWFVITGKQTDQVCEPPGISMMLGWLEKKRKRNVFEYFLEIQCPRDCWPRPTKAYAISWPTRFLQCSLRYLVNTNLASCISSWHDIKFYPQLDTVIGPLAQFFIFCESDLLPNMITVLPVL